MSLLSIQNLSMEYFQGKKRIPAVRQVSLDLEGNETLGLVGESGCGKSTLALVILNLISEREGRITNGQIFFEGQDILRMSSEELSRIRGGEIAMIFQDPFSSLNPVFTIGDQIREVIDQHLGKRDLSLVFEVLRQVRLPDPERMAHAYPHQLSGGQRQRAMIAMAIATHPKLLIADEPTTALDVTIQAEILELLSHLKKQLHMAILLITHNLAVVAQYAQKIAVMYAGEIVETGQAQSLIHEPAHPYTQGLLRSLPRLNQKKRDYLPMLAGQPPNLFDIPPGCPFHPRCERVMEVCKQKVPELFKAGLVNHQTLKDPRSVRCFLYGSS